MFNYLEHDEEKLGNFAMEEENMRHQGLFPLIEVFWSFGAQLEELASWLILKVWLLQPLWHLGFECSVHKESVCVWAAYF